MSSLMTSVTCTRATTNTQRLRTLPVCGSVTKTIETSSTRMSGYKLPWNRGAVESTSPGCWMNQEQNFNCHHPTQLNPKLGRPYFPKINHKPQTKTTNRPSLFLSSYTTKLDQIQYATLFQPNQKIHGKKSPPPQPPQDDFGTPYNI